MTKDSFLQLENLETTGRVRSEEKRSYGNRRIPQGQPLNQEMKRNLVLQQVDGSLMSEIAIYTEYSASELLELGKNFQK